MSPASLTKLWHKKLKITILKYITFKNRAQRDLCLFVCLLIKFFNQIFWGNGVLKECLKNSVFMVSQVRIFKIISWFNILFSKKLLSINSMFILVFHHQVVNGFDWILDQIGSWGWFRNKTNVMGTSRVTIHHFGTIRYLIYWATLQCYLFSTLAYLVQKLCYNAKLVLCKSRGDKFWVDVFLLCWLIGCSQLFPVGVTSHLFHLSMTRQHTSSFHTAQSLS